MGSSLPFDRVIREYSSNSKSSGSSPAVIPAFCMFVSMRKEVFQMIAGNIFWFCPGVLQALSLLFATERLCQETWDSTTTDTNLTIVPAVTLVATVVHFLFGRLREVGKAVTREQHGDLFEPFALEGDPGESAGGRTGIVVARAPRSVVWLRLLSA